MKLPSRKERRAKARDQKRNFVPLMNCEGIDLDTGWATHPPLQTVMAAIEEENERKRLEDCSKGKFRKAGERVFTTDPKGNLPPSETPLSLNVRNSK